MPRGDKSSYTGKQKRMAEHIEEGYEKRGTPKKEAERRKVEIRNYTIIYKLIEDIEAAIKGMLEPKFQEVYLGTVEIRMVFNLTKYGLVAGSHVTDGKITRSRFIFDRLPFDAARNPAG